MTIDMTFTWCGCSVPVTITSDSELSSAVLCEISNALYTAARSYIDRGLPATSDVTRAYARTIGDALDKGGYLD